VTDIPKRGEIWRPRLSQTLGSDVRDVRVMTPEPIDDYVMFRRPGKLPRVERANVFVHSYVRVVPPSTEPEEGREGG
jgi:hypothetical protein